jgi:signal transduction histidine kinase
MLYNFSIDDLISFVTIGALLIAAIYHSVLFYYNRIKMLGSYSIYLWTSLIFLVFANVTKTLDPIQSKIGFAISLSVLWLSYLLYFQFILTPINPIKIEQSKWISNSNRNWLFLPICILVNIIVYIVPKNISPIFSIIALLFNGVILLYGIIILNIIFKEKRHITNRNMLGGGICMLFFNVFNGIAMYNNGSLFGLLSISYICIAYFTEIIFFSIAISHKMRFDLDEKYKALAKIKTQELELEIEKKKASDILLTHTFELHNQRTKAIIEQRTMIGRKLHDDLSGSLIALRYLIQDFKAKAKDANDKENFKALETEISNIYKDARNYSHELSKKSAFDEAEISYDILAYFKKIAEQFNALDLAKINLKIDAQELNKKLNTKQTKHSYFILKECITNTIKHTNAQNIWISIQFDAKECIINYIDDGKGFKSLKPEGIGIKGIRDRADDLNGYIEINTDKNGTSFTIGFNTGQENL